MVRNLKVRNLNLVTFIILNTDLCAFDMKHPQITFCIRILKEATLTNTTHSLYFEPIRAEIRANIPIEVELGLAVIRGWELR